MSTAAVAICVDCGAGLCVEHAVSTSRRLSRSGANNRVRFVDPAARTVRCSICETAVRAANGQPTGKVTPQHIVPAR
jgi:hypothetical protein